VTDRSRRRWIASVGAAGLAVGLPRCAGGPATVARVDVGPLEAWREVRWRLFEAARVIVARDAAGLFAMTAVCPHQGCLVSPRAGAVCVPPEDGATSTTPTLCCACHGSQFDGDGQATSGPAAPAALAHWEVTVQGGRVIVGVGARVAANVRAAEGAT
jgi:Rieske Fe-S protein